MTKTTELNEQTLRQFTGSDTWYRHGLNPKVLYTDGAKYVADAGGAHWLLDTIAISQRSVAGVAAEPFQVWELAMHADRSGTLTCEDGNGNVVYTERIAFTDFPLAEVVLWFANDVIYLPSEH